MRRALAVLLALLFASPALAASGRVALVVGNGAYRTVPALSNPVRDADAVARNLEEAGFEVMRATNVDRSALRERIEAFAAKVEAAGPDGTAVLFFAGHAVQLDGTNYLLPVDAEIKAAADAPAQAVPLSDILKRLDVTSAGAKIVILDACRDNPFLPAGEAARGLALVGETGASGPTPSEAGLARVEAKAGTLVAFSTSPGATAADGTGENSPYADAFLRLMREPGVPVEAVFRRVRVAVHGATNGEQTPWETSSLTREFAFFGSRAGPSAGAVSRTAPSQAFERPATRGVMSRRSAEEAYEIAVHADTIEGYRAFLAVHPEDARALRIHRILALRLEETAWVEAVRLGDAASLAAFRRLFPGSHHDAEAARLLAAAPAQIVRTVALACPAVPAAPPALRAPILLRRVRAERAPAAEEPAPVRARRLRTAPDRKPDERAPATIRPIRAVAPEPVPPARPRPEPQAEPARRPPALVEAPPVRRTPRPEPEAEPVRERIVRRAPPAEVELEEVRFPHRIEDPRRIVRLPLPPRLRPRPGPDPVAPRYPEEAGPDLDRRQFGPRLTRRVPYGFGRVPAIEGELRGPREVRPEPSFYRDRQRSRPPVLIGAPGIMSGGGFRTGPVPRRIPGPADGGPFVDRSFPR